MKEMNQAYKFKPKLEPEPSVLDSLDNQLELSRRLESVYENRPDMDSFVGVMSGTKFEDGYTKEAIEDDKRYVEKRRAGFFEKNSSFGRDRLDHLEKNFQHSEMLQTMTVDCMNKYWFKECKSIMTADYDDLHAGVDAVVQHKKGGHLGLAFDFAIMEHGIKIYEKLENIWNFNVKGGNVPAIKYFEDPETKEKKRLLVPHFVVGASKEDLEVFAKAYLADDITTLENHPFKYLMLLQIEEQLQTALDYYEINKDNDKFYFARSQYEKIQSVLRNMKNEVHMDEKMYKNIDLHEYAK